MSDKPAGALTLGGARGNAARKRLQSINFPPMPDREEMDPVLLHVESVNDPMLANASSKTIRSFQPINRCGYDLSRNPISSIFASTRARRAAGSLKKTASKLE
jgi:hypothetical protein